VPLCVAHLRAALSHLNPGIQLTAISVLVDVLDYFPVALAPHARRLVVALCPHLTPSVSTVGRQAKSAAALAAQASYSSQQPNKSKPQSSGRAQDDPRYDALQCVHALLAPLKDTAGSAERGGLAGASRQRACEEVSKAYAQVLAVLRCVYGCLIAVLLSCAVPFFLHGVCCAAWPDFLSSVC
jgi:hypothetical protein